MITVIVPVYELDAERKRNLEFVYERLVFSNLEIVIAVQAKEPDEYFNKFTKAKVKNFFSEKYNNFNKSFIFNSCLNSELNTPFVLLLDADVYFPFNDLKNQIEESDEVIKPFSECIYFTEEITQDFINKRKAEATPELKRISALGGGALVLRTDLIKEKGLLFDENFNGWGWEDIDFGDLIRFNSLSIKTLNQIAVHLYHKPTTASCFNHKYYHTKEKSKSFIVHVFNCGENSVKNINSYLKHKTKDVLLMNCCDIDYLNNDNIKFSYIKKQIDDSFYLNDIVESSFPFLQDNGWVFFTDAGSKVNEYVYSEILSFDGDYIEFFGCSFDEDNSFISSSINMDGFAIRKHLWSQKNIPKIFANGPYWSIAISNLFSNYKKKVSRNQLRVKKKRYNLLNKVSKSNLKSLDKIINRTKKNTKYDLTLITPTGGRPDSALLCEKFIKSNCTDLKLQWIVVNDFDDRDYPFATDMIFCSKLGHINKNPIGKSIKEAIKYINSDFVLFIEDDDWYAPDYIQYYFDNLQKCSLFGQAFARFYNVKNRSYDIRNNSTSASLSQTGIKTSLLMNYIHCFDEEYSPFHDIILWNSIEDDKILEMNSDKCIGIKGSKGRDGIGYGHKELRYRDAKFLKLKEWIGEDYKLYLPKNAISQAENDSEEFFIPGILANSKNEKFYDSKNVLYFSPYSPDFDMSSGGDRLLKILQILKIDLDFDVHFMCNAFKNEKHLQVLRDIDIKCYTPEGGDYLLGHLKRLRAKMNFDYVIFSWYDIAAQYVEFVKKLFPNIKVIIDSVDIHWKRESRGVEQGLLNYDKETLQKRKEEEKKIYADSDVIFVVTHNDKQDLLDELGYVNIKILSNIHEQKDETSGGNDMVFIGNFLHVPNVKAALDSIDIYKKFSETDCFKNLQNKPKLYIVGPNAPKEIKESVDGENCIFLGYVQDLDELYKNVRVSLAPLRWGSGVKGKICDAASRGVLILTSDVGNEGINLEDSKSGFIANTNEEFVEKLVKIYCDLENIGQISKSGKAVVNGLVSRESAVSVLKHTLKPKPITVIIITYSKAEVVKKCVQSILDKTEYPNYKIVVVDNASTDNTEDVMKELQSQNPDKIDYYRSETNDFFIIPNNRIMLDEKYKDGDVCLVNDDMEIVSKCWLSYLYTAAYSEHNVCAVGGKIVYPDGTLAEGGAELYNNGSGRNLGRGLNSDHDSYNYPRYTGYVSGCLMYMRRDAIEKIGVFDEDLIPMYYEDSEWQYRGHLNGLKTIYEPRAEAIHYEGKDESKHMKKYQAINRQKFLEKYAKYNIEQYNPKFLE